MSVICLLILHVTNMTSCSSDCGCCCFFPLLAYVSRKKRTDQPTMKSHTINCVWKGNDTSGRGCWHSWHSDSSWLPVVRRDGRKTARRLVDGWWRMETDTWQGPGQLPWKQQGERNQYFLFKCFNSMMVCSFGKLIYLFKKYVNHLNHV